jgi:hypothetical protein
VAPQVEDAGSAGNATSSTAGDTQGTPTNSNSLSNKYRHVEEPLPPLEGLSDTCIECLTNIFLIQAGLDASDVSTKAIARRLCTKNELISITLCRQVRIQLWFGLHNYHI